MYIIILAVIIIAIFCLIGRKTNEDENARTIATNISSASVQTKQKKQRSLKHERTCRHKRIWAVLRFMKEFQDVKESSNFYEFEKTDKDFNLSLSRLSDEEFTPYQEDIESAIRFCQCMRSKGECGYSMTDEDIENIYNWRTFIYDKQDILFHVSERFKDYWDDVLLNYKRPADRIKRINYLVNHLDEMKNKKIFSEISGSQEVFSSLADYYKQMLAK